MNFGENFIQEGLVNRITPFHTNMRTNFDTEKVYRNVMTRYKYGGLQTKGLYLDETVMRMCYTHRRLFGTLINHLIAEGKMDKAKKAIDYAEKVIPEYNVPMNYWSGGIDFVEAYYALGRKDKAERVLKTVWNNSVQYLNWYLSLAPSRFMSSQRECVYHIYTLKALADLAAEYGSPLAEKRMQEFSVMLDRYTGRGGSLE